MITANELRIGNWVVLGNTPYPSKVFTMQHELRAGFLINKFPVEGLHPIPLTPEILEKAGFKWSESEERYLLSSSGVLFEGLDYSVSVGTDQSFVTPFGGEYKYLHQLQNLYFALTGQELKIEL